MALERGTLQSDFDELRIPDDWRDPWLWASVAPFFADLLGHALFRVHIGIGFVAAAIFLGLAANQHRKARYLQKARLQPRRVKWLRYWTLAFVLVSLVLLAMSWDEPFWT